MPRGAHIAPKSKNSTLAECIAYCKKEETRYPNTTYWQFGTEPKQGERTDIEEAIEEFKLGKSFRDVVINNPKVSIRYPNGIKMWYSAFVERPRNPSNSVTVHVFYGPRGTGKSRIAWEKWPEAYSPSPCDVWFDGYSGQDCVLIDDYRGWYPYAFLLNLLDRYPLRVQVKGGMVQMQATTFVITSNKCPSQWYSEDWSPLERRITHLYEVLSDVVKIIKKPSIYY